MNRLILGAFVTMILLGVGLFWLEGRAQVEQGAPPPDPVEEEEGDRFALAELPEADFTGMEGPTPPEASELTREQRRFFRYDYDRNWRISRHEMLASRTNAFRKLDVDGNNLLTFEEWAVATVEKFDGADADGNRELTPAEFATTAPRPTKPKPRCTC